MQSPPSDSSATVSPVPPRRDDPGSLVLACRKLKPLETESDFVIDGQLEGDDLFIRNELLCCRGIRKIHLELAALVGTCRSFTASGSQTLTLICRSSVPTSWPVRPGSPLRSWILSPVTEALPLGIESALVDTPCPAFRQVRDLPGWGTIFPLTSVSSDRMVPRKRRCSVSG